MAALFAISTAERRSKDKSWRVGNTVRRQIMSMFTGVNMLQSHSEARLQMARMMLLFFISVSWAMMAFSCTTLESTLPLRPLLLLLNNQHLRSVAVCIGRTLRARGTLSVALCFLLIWFLASLYATIVLSSQGAACTSM